MLPGFFLSLSCISMIAGIVTLFIFLIKAARKRSLMNTGIALGCFFWAFIILFALGIITNPTVWCDHEFQVAETIEADCVEAERIIRHCDLCGLDRTETVGVALGHDMREVERTEATVEQEGKIVEQCSRCGYEEHTITEKLPTPEPTPTDTPKPTEKPTPTPMTGGKDDVSEILFRNIPWGTDSTEVANLLESEGSGIGTFLLDGMIMQYPDNLFDVDIFRNVPNGGSWLSGYNMKAGGYDVSDATMYFSYKVEDGKVNRDTDEFYAAVYYFDVNDYETVYNSLQKKLNELYGEGTEKKSTKSGLALADDYSGRYEYDIREITWEGANNTFAKLRWQSCENEAASLQVRCGVYLAYGKSDAGDKLDELAEAIENEQAENDRKASDSDDIDGL